MRATRLADRYVAIFSMCTGGTGEWYSTWIIYLQYNYVRASGRSQLTGVLCTIYIYVYICTSARYRICRLTLRTHHTRLRQLIHCGPSVEYHTHTGRDTCPTVRRTRRHGVCVCVCAPIMYKQRVIIGRNNTRNVTLYNTGAYIVVLEVHLPHSGPTRSSVRPRVFYSAYTLPWSTRWRLQRMTWRVCVAVVRSIVLLSIIIYSSTLHRYICIYICVYNMCI